jgi:hypothetical protein
MNPMLLIATLLLTLFDQSVAPNRILNPTSPTLNPGDPRSNQFDDLKGANWRVFAVNSAPDRAVVITQVEEVRQQNPPSTWGVYVGNADVAPVVSLTVAAAVVDATGKVRATQNLQTIKNLKPQQVVRKEIPIRVTVLMPTDRVVFYVREVKSESVDWKAVDSDVAELIKQVAAKFPVP